MDGCLWISGFAVIILKYLLHGRLLLNNCWNNPEIPGVYITHYSVRVVRGPSRVRVGQKNLSSSRVSSTRWTLLLMEVYDNLDFWPYNGEIKKVIWPVGVGGLFHHNSKTFKWKVLSWSIRKDFATPPSVLHLTQVQTSSYTAECRCCSLQSSAHWITFQHSPGCTEQSYYMSVHISVV